MELVVRKSDLVGELQLFQGIVERKTTIPILANLRLEARDNELHFLATDLEVGLRSRCAASIAKGGALTLPAKKLYEIVKALPDAEVRIEDDKGSTVKIAADRFDSRLQTKPLDEYPTLPDAPADAVATLPGALLKAMIEKIQFAMTSEDTRYFLNGALLVVRGDGIGLVSTDGHRLAHAWAAREGAIAPGEEVRAILPRKTVWEFGRLLAETDGDVRFLRGENHQFFEVGQRVLISRVIEAQFPAYEKVIPKNNDKLVEFDRERITSAIRRVALLSNERSRAIKIEIEPGRAEFSSSSAEIGEARETVTTDYAGEPVRTSFNAQYLLDFLNVVGTDAVVMELKDEVSQAVMKPAGNNEFDYTYVLMPMRI